MSTRRKLWTATKTVLFLCVLGLLYVVLRSIGFREVMRQMERIRWRHLLAAGLLQLGVFVLWTLRWQQLMKREERRGLLRLFPIYMAGVFVNMITPGARVGGEPVRAYYMSAVFGGRKSTYMGTVLADRMANMVVFLSLVIFSTLYILFLVPLGPVPKLALQGGVLFAVAVVVSGFLLRKKVGAESRFTRWLLSSIYEMRFLAFLRRRFPTYEQFEDYAIDRLGNVFRPIRRTFRRPRQLTKAVVIGLVSWFVFFLANYVLFRSLGADIGALPVFVIFVISIMCGAAGISPGGAGVMEAAMIGLCAAFGLEYDTAAAVTLVSRGLFYLYGVGFGGLCLGSLYVFRRLQPLEAGADGE